MEDRGDSSGDGVDDIEYLQKDVQDKNVQMKPKNNGIVSPKNGIA